MDLDSLTIEIRPRRAYEAIDLGLRLARANAVALWGVFVPVVLAAGAAICLLLRDSPGWAALLVWWLKPCYDRVALHVLSRAVFGETIGVRAGLKALPRVMRGGMLRALTTSRFDAARSLNLALWQLEHLRGAAWRRRMALIETPVRATAGWLTVTFAWFELTLAATVAGTLMFMVPEAMWESVTAWWWSLTARDVLFQWVALGTWILSVAILEPLYVAGGFGLYLNRRAELEAWDIEIAFRRMAQRGPGPQQEAA